ncbi:MAG: SNF2-related protein [Microthrixaceae bacterium]
MRPRPSRTRRATWRVLRDLPSNFRLAMTGTPVENSLGDPWAILDFVNPDLVGERADFVSELSHAGSGEAALRVLNGILVFRRTKAEPEIAAGTTRGSTRSITARFLPSRSVSTRLCSTSSSRTRAPALPTTRAVY